jgi:hypothetical protein
VGLRNARNRTLRVSAQLCGQSEVVRRVSTTGPQIDVAVALIGPAVCLTHVQFITKLTELDDTHSDIPWHQDSGYGRLDPLLSEDGRPVLEDPHSWMVAGEAS